MPSYNRRKPKGGKVLPPEFEGKAELKEGEWVKKEKPARISYSQNWHTYNQYQTGEKLMFYKILNDAVDSLDIQERYGQVGRPYNLMRDMIKCCIIKVFSGLSCRRVISELRLVQKFGYIKKVPHYASIINYFDNPEMEKYLSILYRMLALPLKGIEKRFAVDATGFSTTLKTDWVRDRFSFRKRGRWKWKKLHAICGVSSHIITSVRITHANEADTKYFSDLVDDTSKNFSIQQVSADAGYLARSNVETVSNLGGIAYIMPKSNTFLRSRGKGAEWIRFIRMWKNNREEFLKCYHQRSNIESAFSMLKRKFSTNMRNKNDQTQRNEILCKVICHNISVLVNGIFELDLKLDWN